MFTSLFKAKTKMFLKCIFFLVNYENMKNKENTHRSHTSSLLSEYGTWNDVDSSCNWNLLPKNMQKIPIKRIEKHPNSIPPHLTQVTILRKIRGNAWKILSKF